MYIAMLVDAPELKEMFSDYIAYLFLSKQLLDNPYAYGSGKLLAVTKGLQDASEALRQAIEAFYPHGFCRFISSAADRIIDRTPDAEAHFIRNLNRKLIVNNRYQYRPIS